MRKAKILAILNLVILAALIFWNYYSNTGVIEGNTVGSVSNKYNNLFTPAGYTFGIWALIYIGLLVQAGYFLRIAFSDNRKKEKTVNKATPWLILANISNGLWLWFWLNESTGISVLFIFLMFSLLLGAVFNLNMEKWDAPVSYMAGVWWPIDIYVGWIAVASIANVAAHLTAINWQSGLSEVYWTVVMIIAATVINLVMVLTRNMREFAAVGMWAIIGIAVRHWGEIPTIQWTSIICVSILFIVTAIHAYQNRSTLPHKKLQRGEA